MTLLQKMDRLVYATRIDRVLFMKMAPRTLRWLPLVVLAALIAGYVQMASASPGDIHALLIGALIFWGAYLAAGFIRVFGPRLTGTGRQPLDERELMVRARAYGISGAALAALVWLGCFYMAGADALRLWQPQGYEWVNLGFALQAGAMLLPSWVASWLQPRPAPLDDD